MIYISKQDPPTRPVPIKEIARSIDSPELFIAKILQDLSRQGYVSSSKGRSGGFFLTAAQMEISLKEIIIATDGDQMFLGCGLGLEYCSEKRPCPIHFKYKEAREKLSEVYGSFTLLSLHSLEMKDPSALRRSLEPLLFETNI